MDPRKQTLIIMLKEPRPGLVKTRLGRDIGHVAAAWWYRHQVQRLLRGLEDPRWRLVLAVSPDHTGMQSRAWPAHLTRIPQGCGDLGTRMARLLRQVPGRVCIIGSDIPGITPRHIAHAFKAMACSEAVFGPAPDGGFWLVGMRAVPARLFTNVRWSSAHALADSMASLSQKRIAFIESLQDVDTRSDLQVTLGRARAR
jgi:rSAM/selenodomain-associated transferase 1